MKIRIKSGEGFGFALWLPTPLAKCRFVRKSIKKRCDIDIQPLMVLFPQIRKALKEFIKKNGRLVLVDIESADGDKVLIIV